MAAMRPKARTDLTVVQLDGEAVIYDEVSGELHHLNPSATLVFDLLDGTATVKELAADVAEAFGLSSGEVESQIRVLVRRFRALGLLHGAPAPSRG
jgi:PqqD family protein of HPr-rel-A system